MKLEPTLKCPDCSKLMNLTPGTHDVFFCKPCLRFRVKEHLEPYQEPAKTLKAKFKRLRAS